MCLLRVGPSTSTWICLVHSQRCPCMLFNCITQWEGDEGRRAPPLGSVDSERGLGGCRGW